MSSQAVQAAIQDNAAYIGVWTNWSQGKIQGATITLTQRNGGFLIAFLALFVTLTGTCFWMIVAFTMHQIMSRESAQDAIYHQRQAILRNSESGAIGCWKLLGMFWAWRRHQKVSIMKRISAPLLLGLTVLLGFSVAGVFSSKVATERGGEVLVDGSACGLFVGGVLGGTGKVTPKEWGELIGYTTQRLQSSLNYALMCYKNNSATQNCRTFVRPNLPLRSTQAIPCPFPGQDEICRNSSGGIRFDSGLINSHSDLGINAAPQDRFLYRSVKECAPIRNEGFTWINSTSHPKTIQFSYGPTFSHINSTFIYAAETPMDPNTGYTPNSSYRMTDYYLE
jgi:hypothetical protein